MEGQYVECFSKDWRNDDKSFQDEPDCAVSAGVDCGFLLDLPRHGSRCGETTTGDGSFEDSWNSARQYPVRLASGNFCSGDNGFRGGAFGRLVRSSVGSETGCQHREHLLL